MGIEDYINAQRANVESIKNLPHFSVLGKLVDQLYNLAIVLIPKDTPLHYSKFLLLCHKSFLSALTLIGQAQPEDAAAISRRAIEIARVAIAVKTHPKNAETWLSFEKRMERWEARDKEEKPRHLSTPLDLPLDHPILKDLEKQLGILSDSYIHFTPEFLGSLNWKYKENRIELGYFISDQRIIERDLIALTGIHASILRILDECLGGCLLSNTEWLALWRTLEKEGGKLAEPFDPSKKKNRSPDNGCQGNR